MLVDAHPHFLPAPYRDRLRAWGKPVAMRELVLTHDLTPETVASVTVTLDEAAEEMLIHARPENELQAKFSIEFCLAAVLRSQTPAVDEFDSQRG